MLSILNCANIRLECPGTAETAANQKTVDEKLTSGSHKPKEVVGTGVVEGGSNLQKYKWSEQQVSSIMGAFYYGYMITQIPGGENLTLLFGVFDKSSLTKELKTQGSKFCKNGNLMAHRNLIFDLNFAVAFLEFV